MNKYLYVVTLSFFINLIVILPTSATIVPNLEITYPSNSETVPSTDLTVEGISANESLRNCKIYLHVNGASQLVTGVVPVTSGDEAPPFYQGNVPVSGGNYSVWFSQLDNSSLKIGSNNLTAFYTCPNAPSSNDHDSLTFTVDPDTPLDVREYPEDLPSTGGGRLESATN